MEKTCRDCIHHEICVLLLQNTDAVCNGFADKSRYIELPCKVGDTVYCVDINEGKGKIAERPVANFGIGLHGLYYILYVDGYGPYTTAPGEMVFTTREEAEAALRKVEEKRLMKETET